MYIVTILFKSGNTLKLKVKSFHVTKNGENVEKIKYELVSGQLLHLDVTQIEAVTSRKHWF